MPTAPVIGTSGNGISNVPAAPWTLRETAELTVGVVVLQTVEVSLMVSMRDPGLVGATLLSEPWRHLNITFWPTADAGRFTTVVMYVGAAAVPPESPVQAIRLGNGFPKVVGNVEL